MADQKDRDELSVRGLTEEEIRKLASLRSKVTTEIGNDLSPDEIQQVTGELNSRCQGIVDELVRIHKIDRDDLKGAWELSYGFKRDVEFPNLNGGINRGEEITSVEATVGKGSGVVTVKRTMFAREPDRQNTLGETLRGFQRYDTLRLITIYSDGYTHFSRLDHDTGRVFEGEPRGELISYSLDPKGRIHTCGQIGSKVGIRHDLTEIKGILLDVYNKLFAVPSK